MHPQGHVRVARVYFTDCRFGGATTLRRTSLEARAREASDGRFGLAVEGLDVPDFAAFAERRPRTSRSAAMRPQW
jgi:hypothetical protein